MINFRDRRKCLQEEKEKGKINFGWKLALETKPRKAKEGIISNATQNGQLNEHCFFFPKPA